MKPRGQQKQIIRKRAAQRASSMTPARWFNIIIATLVLGVIAIVAFGYLKQWL
jgi:hypothetical protein